MNRTLSTWGVVTWIAFGFAACQSPSRPVDAETGESGAAGDRSDEPTAGAGAVGGTSGSGASAGTAGSAGNDVGGTRPGAGGDAGAPGEETAGAAGEAAISVEIDAPTIPSGKTYVAYEATVSAIGGDGYDWSISSGSLPAGLKLENTTSAAVRISGTPTEAGQFPLTLNVASGSSSAEIELTLTIAHSALFLSDRDVSGVSELFVSEVGDAMAPVPTRLNASLPTGGGVSSYAWSPDGSRVLYQAKQSASGKHELWVSLLATPGSAKRVSATGAELSFWTWLGKGNIAAYMTSNGSAYLVDLSGSTPGASKLAVAASTRPYGLYPSPNGTSVAVLTQDEDPTPVTTLSYVTWSAGSPKSVNLGEALDMSFSYDGRLGMARTPTAALWWDLSLASPVAHDFVNFNNLAWSSTAEALLYSPGADCYLGTFSGPNLSSRKLADEAPLLELAWSPDGASATFNSGQDVRGIADVLSAPVNSDFSLLPSGFSSAASNADMWIGFSGWSPDSKWIALRADRDAKNQEDLHLIRWSAPGTAYKAHANTIGAGVSTSAFSPNSQAIAFVGTVSPQANSGLYLTQLPSKGAPPQAELVSAPAASIVQTDIAWLPGSRVLAYRATVSGKTQLFALPVDADGKAGDVVSISGVSGSGVSSYQLAPRQ